MLHMQNLMTLLSGEATQPSHTDESQGLSLEESEFSTFSQGDVTITGTGTDLSGGSDTNSAETKDGEKSVTENMAEVKTTAAKTGSKDTSREVTKGSVPPVPTPTITPYSPQGCGP